VPLFKGCLIKIIHQAKEEPASREMFTTLLFIILLIEASSPVTTDMTENKIEEIEEDFQRPAT
jgi:hypothetical protein